MNKSKIFGFALDCVILIWITAVIVGILLNPAMTPTIAFTMLCLMASGYLLPKTVKSLLSFYTNKEWKK